jgi:hypothetical protein
VGRPTRDKVSTNMAKSHFAHGFHDAFRIVVMADVTLAKLGAIAGQRWGTSR